MFIQGLMSINAEESAAVQFRVTVSGYPEPRVTFCKNREVIKHSERYRIGKLLTVQEGLIAILTAIEESLGNGSWSLNISNLNISDSAQITAFAANRMGKVSCRAALAVSKSE